MLSLSLVFCSYFLLQSSWSFLPAVSPYMFLVVFNLNSELRIILFISGAIIQQNSFTHCNIFHLISNVLSWFFCYHFVPSSTFCWYFWLMQLFYICFWMNKVLFRLSMNHCIMVLPTNNSIHHAGYTTLTSSFYCAECWYRL